MSDVFTLMRERFKEAKRKYVDLQNEDLEQNPSFATIYFSKKVPFDKKVIRQYLLMPRKTTGLTQLVMNKLQSSQQQLNKFFL